MPLKLTRRLAKQNADSEILQLAVSLTSLTKDLADMSCFPPATAVVCVLLLIMETVQEVQANKEGCNRLARRCATMLLNISDQMSGRWEYAPHSLVKNLVHLQETLESIHIFMKQAASASWTSRFLRKNSIETALGQYHERLDDAARCFQISTLIEIHYAMKPVAEMPSGRPKLEPQPDQEPPPYLEPQLVESTVESRMVMSLLPDVHAEADTDIVSDAVLEDLGFRRYHQSEVLLRGRSRMEDGWWSGTSEANVNGQPALIKRYEGPRERANKEWIRDVKALQRLFHPNLPQMLGYSADAVSTPFILLSNVRTRSPESFLLGSLRNSGVASCAENMLRFYSDIVEATIYTQQQMSLSDKEAQDFLENSSLRIDDSSKVVIGLPVLDRATVTWRSYPLNETIRMVVLKMLPNRGIVQYNHDSVVVEQDPTWQLTQLTALIANLLPPSNDPPGLPTQIKNVLSARDDSWAPSPLSLRQLRMLSIEADGHSYVWKTNTSIPAHKFSVGDIGFIPGGKGWDSFVTLGNVFEDGLADFPVKRDASGVHWCWKDVPVRHSSLQNFELPQDVHCWPVAVQPGTQVDCQILYQSVLTIMKDAWHFLLENAIPLGKKWNIAPQSIILITKSGTDQTFAINDFGGALQSNLRHNMLPAPGRRGPPPFFPRETLPRIMYLSTSSRAEYEPCWSHAAVSSSSHPTLERGWTYRIGWKTGFINWAQLHVEDFKQ
ncbi:hypothetical protein C8F04DRAFT_1080699 [Mycena alexandri]|uniref:Mixed lineage kinase domain-containing protein n=1 Tax=Mycena alexandri TaxID=1745969 RepID=A0AAD6T985_9AGAR|nr:hypothetical protein C8F04DRAFT_1080699 [Mycena alexandri]